MNVPFRLYGLPGCQFCEKAAQFLFQEKVPAQLVVVGADPIAQEGIKKVLGSEQITVPCLVSAVGAQAEVIVGFKEEDYRRVVGTFRALTSASAIGAPAAEINNSGEAAAGSVEPPSSAEGTA